MRAPTLQFQTVVLLDRSVSKAHAVRRPLLVNRNAGLPHELSIAFLLREYGLKRLYTQLAVLADLAFFLEWLSLRAKRAAFGKPRTDFVSPERRVLSGSPALTHKEIADFCRWAHLPAKKLAEASHAESPSFAQLAEGRAVAFNTSNRRIKTIGRYMAWLTRECDQRLELSANEQRALDASAASIREAFDSHLADGDDCMEVRSLDGDAKKSFESVITSYGPYDSSTPIGRRDRLILETLYESGLRPGELLSLYCTDVTENWEYKPGQFTGCLKVVIADNDSADTRVREPSCKTFSGLVPIPRELTVRLLAYITEDREEAVSQSGRSTPHLFVNHEGIHKGLALSQRNLNRIAAKLKLYQSIPSTMAPYVLRHTHFDHVYETASSKGNNPRDVLLQRGRWSHKSTMPSRYAMRAIAKHSAELVQARDHKISRKGNSR